jgi:hypothetical protein
MKTAEHSPTAEDVMAYLDGELPPDLAATVQTHIAGCEQCRRVRDDLRSTAREMMSWDVDEPPATVRLPPAAETKPRTRQSLFGVLMLTRRFQFAVTAGFVVLVVLVAQVSMRTGSRRSAASSAQQIAHGTGSVDAGGTGDRARTRVAEMPQRPAGRAPVGTTYGGAPLEPPPPAARSIHQAPSSSVESVKGPLIARTARLRILSTDFDSVRPALDRVLKEVGGFVGQIDAAGARGEPRSLTATVRVPADKLDTALAGLKRLGTVVEESQTGDDVTEQVVDLDARLSNARNTEKRLIDLLQHRTGKVSDVLEAEREVARVRGEIERLDAQRKNLAGRVTYATVTLQISEERKASLDLGPSSMSGRFENALLDGLLSAFGSIVGTVLFLMRVGPFVLLWVLILAWPARLVLSRLGRRPARS